MTAFLILLCLLIVVAWFCVSMQVAFMVGDATKGSGLDFVWFMLTCVAMLGLPFVVADFVWNIW